MTTLTNVGLGILGILFAILIYLLPWGLTGIIIIRGWKGARGEIARWRSLKLLPPFFPAMRESFQTNENPGDLLTWGGIIILWGLVITSAPGTLYAGSSWIAAGSILVAIAVWAWRLYAGKSQWKASLPKVRESFQENPGGLIYLATGSIVAGLVAISRGMAWSIIIGGIGIVSGIIMVVLVWIYIIRLVRLHKTEEITTEEFIDDADQTADLVGYIGGIFNRALEGIGDWLKVIFWIGLLTLPYLVPLAKKKIAKKKNKEQKKNLLTTEDILSRIRVMLLEAGVPVNLVQAWPDWSGMDLKGVDLHGVRLLTRVNMSNANLEKANLLGVDLSGADLSGADLTGANLERANLRDANLINANLTGANLTGVSLYRAKMYGATLPDGN
jgi:hypothetical protein